MRQSFYAAERNETFHAKMLNATQRSFNQMIMKYFLICGKYHLNRVRSVVSCEMYNLCGETGLHRNKTVVQKLCWQQIDFGLHIE